MRSIQFHDKHIGRKVVAHSLRSRAGVDGKPFRSTLEALEGPNVVVSDEVGLGALEAESLGAGAVPEGVAIAPIAILNSQAPDVVLAVVTVNTHAVFEWLKGLKPGKSFYLRSIDNVDADIILVGIGDSSAVLELLINRTL